MSQDFQPGDYLVFQIESGFGLLRLLDIEVRDGEKIWHLAAFRDMFLDVESADDALKSASGLTVSHPHLALTNRAFESTQTARMINIPLNDDELHGLHEWRAGDAREVSDRSVRLLLGMR